MAWLRNKKTGGWFEVPDEQLNTNNFMNNKIREKTSGKFNNSEDDDLNLDENEYFYHNTKKDSLKGIKEEGLIPQTDVGFYEKGLFFAEYDNIEETKVYGDIRLRVPKKYVQSPQRYIGNYYTTKKISPEKIQIFKEGKWEYI